MSGQEGGGKRDIHTYMGSVRKLKGKRQFERVIHRWEDNIKIVVKKYDGTVQNGFMRFRVGTYDHLL